MLSVVLDMNATEAENMLAQLQQGRPKHARKERSELDDLDQRLMETVSWCMRYSVRQKMRRCLRPARLTPPPLPQSRSDAVERVIAMRREEFERTCDVTLNDVAGQLLVYFPDASRADGAAETASKDFFDVHNAPPYGTWVGYFEDRGADPTHSSYLLAYVPQVFLDYARDGVDANKDGSLRWLRNTHLALRHILKYATFGRGLL
jgi:hypothetical protein